MFVTGSALPEAIERIGRLPYVIYIAGGPYPSLLPEKHHN